MKWSVIFFLAVSTLVFGTPTAFAQSPTDTQATAPAELSPTPSDYTLPYPGILPDSPFYFFKVTRDRVIGFLIADPLKKSEFDLLQAEKRLGAGRYLAEKKSYVLAESTFSKGLNYFDDSLDRLGEAKKEGADIAPLHSKIVGSIGEHREVYKKMEARSSGDFKKKLLVFEERLGAIEKKANKLNQ